MKKLLIIIALLAATASASSILINSFNSGELSEDMKHRHDLEKTVMGADELENVLIRPQGMAYRRPGTEFIDTQNVVQIDIAEQIGDYPILRTTSNQADPGLPHEIEIATFDDLEQIGSFNANYPLDGHYYMTADIDASETQSDSYDHPNPLYGATGHWLPIGKGHNESGFTGTFDGCGYTISGLSCEYSGVGRGLFGIISGECTIANLTLKDVRIQSDDTSGGLVGLIDPDYLAGSEGDVVIQNCHTSGFVKDSSAAGNTQYGGLIGQIRGSTDLAENVYVYDCSSSCDLTMGTISSNLYNIGGLIGQASYCTISNCYATGDIVCTGPNLSSSQRVGGFIGLASDGCKIEYCYATGDLEGTPNATNWGGLVGQINDSANGYIKKSYATGDVDATGVAGGFFGNTLGSTPWIEDAYAWGNVVTDTTGGGFGGTAGANGDVNQVYSIGTVTDASNIGGLVGAWGGMSFSDTYWDTQTSGLATSAAGEGHTTTWLKTNPNYPDSWDFDNIWYQAYTPGSSFWTLGDIRLIPFEYSTDDAYVLEFGHRYIGFFRTTR